MSHSPLATVRITLEAPGVDEDQSAREWTGWVMAQPLGRRVIALHRRRFCRRRLGLAVKAFRAPYREALDATREQRVFCGRARLVRHHDPRLRFFHGRRFLGVAAYNSDSFEAVSLAGVLRAMQHQAHGGILLGIAALGLLAFGFFEIIEAATRRAIRGEAGRTGASAQLDDLP